MQVVKYQEPQLIPLPIMRALVEVYYDFQKQRVATFNNVLMNADRNGITKEDLKERFGVLPLIQQAETFEKTIKQRLTQEIQHYKIYTEWLKGIQGIGPVLTAGLIANIEHPSRFKYISKLWVYAGIGMNTFCPKCEKPTSVDYEFENRDKKLKKAKKLKPMSKCNVCHSDTYTIMQRRTKGYQSNFNSRMKVLCWKITESFIKQKAEKSAYRKMYDMFKQDELEKHPEKIVENGKTKFNKGHLHNRAKNRVAKLFLSHLWQKWCEIEGLEITKPYVVDKLEHNYLKPFEQ